MNVAKEFNERPSFLEKRSEVSYTQSARRPLHVKTLIRYNEVN